MLTIEDVSGNMVHAILLLGDHLEIVLGVLNFVVIREHLTQVKDLIYVNEGMVNY